MGLLKHPTHLQIMACAVRLALWLALFTGFCTSSQNVQTFDYGSYCPEVLKDSNTKLPPGHSPLPSFNSNSSRFLDLQWGSFRGGSPLFDTASEGFALLEHGQITRFTIQNASVTEGQYLVQGTLTLRERARYWFNRTTVFKSNTVARRARRSQAGFTSMNMKGVWSPYSGILCMAACFRNSQPGQSKSEHDCLVKASFQYPRELTIKYPLVKGKLESQRQHSDPLFFETILITAVPEQPYVYTQEDELSSVCALRHNDVPAKINVWKDGSAPCQFPWYKQPLRVIWDPICTGQDCGPFEGVDSSTDASLSILNMKCAGGMIRGYFVFNYSVKQMDRAYSEVLAVEGKWNAATGQLCMLACYLKGAANESLSFESTCDITITLQFPTTLDLLFRYSVVGKVEQNRGSVAPSFKPFTFTGHMDITYGSLGWGRAPPRLEYSYTREKLDQAQGQCQAEGNNKARMKQRGRFASKYPDAYAFSDLGFLAKLMDSSGLKTQAYFSLISMNDQTNRYYNPNMPVVTAVPLKKRSRNMNVSFDLNFEGNKADLKLLHNTSSARMSAEGVYNSRTGMLCLVACRTIEFTVQKMKHLEGNDKDCQVLVKLQYPSINPGYFGERRVKGRMVSLREQNDPLFFEPLSLSSDPVVYHKQAADSLLEIDVEIVMGIVSLTMAALFICLQLHHVKRNPDALTHISLLMLFVLIMGHLIPLVLNFEAIFTSRSRQNILQWSGGWLEINEVVVRLMTMLVFLLLIRLLHLAWTSKGALSTSKGPLFMEQSVLYICLTTYFIGFVIALIVQAFRGGNLVDRMKAFAGLTVDFFLFPQIVGNCVWGLQGSVLSLPFYVGMTLVRSLPHVYDTIRSFEFISLKHRRYYYASPTWDFYSNAWDVIIPCGCLICSVLVFLQQRYGGSFFLPTYWRQRISYQKISTNVS